MGRDKVGLFGVGGIYGDPPIGGSGGHVVGCGCGGGGKGSRRRRSGTFCKVVPWLILGMTSVVSFGVVMGQVSRMEGDRREAECRSAIQAEIRRIDEKMEADYRGRVRDYLRVEGSGSVIPATNGNIRFAGDRVTVGHGEDRGVLGGWREFDRSRYAAPIYVMPSYVMPRYYDPAPYVPVPYWGGNGGMGYRQGWMPGINGNAGSWIGTAIPGGGGN